MGAFLPCSIRNTGTIKNKLFSCYDQKVRGNYLFYRDKEMNIPIFNLYTTSVLWLGTITFITSTTNLRNFSERSKNFPISQEIWSTQHGQENKTIGRMWVTDQPDSLLFLKTTLKTTLTRVLFHVPVKSQVTNVINLQSCL